MKYELKLYKKTYTLNAEQVNTAYRIMHTLMMIKSHKGGLV